MTYKKKLQKLLTYLLILIPITYLVNISLNNSSSRLSAANLMLGIISIPCCILYYKMNNSYKLFLYTLIYISLFIEIFFNSLIYDSIFLRYDSLNTIFLFRAIILFILLFPKDIIVNFIIKYNKSSILITIILNTLLIILDHSIFVTFSISRYFIFIIIIILISCNIIITLLLIRGMKEKNFVETIYAASLNILAFRTFFIMPKAFEPLHAILYFNVFFFLSFFIILGGLFVEIQCILLYNNKLNKDIEEMREIEKLRTQFFANLSHEFKTPLNIISSSMQLLDIQKEKNPYEFKKNYLKHDKSIKKNCYRMMRLTNNLVDITMINSGFINENFNNYNIVELVENTSMSVVPYLKNKNICLTFDTLIEEVIIKCNPDYIQRIILNVLSNCIKFSKPDGNISIFMDADDDFVTIKVADDGIGIEKNKLSTIFEPFIQEDKSLTRKKEGSGIGLSLVKSLVEFHNGTVYFNPDIVVGSEIIINLPNIKLNESHENTNNYTLLNSDIVSKINIEFSDIYD